MKNKTKNKSLNTIDSDGYKKFNMPDYPDYPDCDDIYNIYLNRNELDPEYIFKSNASIHLSKKHESIQRSY